MWVICLLHTNELPLRHLLRSQGMETSGANTFTGEIGDLIKDEVHLFEVDPNFEKIESGETFPEISDAVVSDLSTDQKYIYQIVKMILTGNLDMSVLKQIIGPLNHSRWLTCASRICRVWVSKHNLRKNSKTYKSLRIIVTFIVTHYAPMWFHIKSKPNVLNGPRHVLKMVQLTSKYCSEDTREIVEPVIQRGAWQAHSENMLLSMMGSDDEIERRFAIKKIIEIRGDKELGDDSVRDFHVPTLKWDADSLFNLIDWSGENEPIYEPVITCSFTNEELKQFLDKPLPADDVPCHTQSCERAVKVSNSTDKFIILQNRN